MDSDAPPATCFERSPDVVARRVDGETILVPVRGAAADLEQIYLLNQTAAEVWELIDGRRGIAEIGIALAERFEANPAAIAADVALFVDDLLARKCIRAA